LLGAKVLPTKYVGAEGDQANEVLSNEKALTVRFGSFLIKYTKGR
jgi:hypothetical protein